MIPSTTRFVYAGLSLFLGLALAGIFGSGLRYARPGADSPTATFFVTNTDDSGPGSLRAAIQNANLSPGSDLINISAVGTVQLMSPLPAITDTLTLQGPGVDLFLVDGQDLYRVFEISSPDATISNLTVQYGLVTSASEYGAGIRATGNLSLINVAVLSNTAQSHGGGLYLDGDLNLIAGVFRNNHSTNGVGGGMRINGIAVITGTHFLDNSSRGDGGGAFALQALTLSDGLFRENRCEAASCDGGGLFSFSHTTVLHTEFISNTAQDQGGAVAASGILTVNDAIFQSNQTVYGMGGGLFAQNQAAIQATKFLSNTARSFGGGLNVSGTAALTDVLFQNNQSIIGAGGGMHAAGSVSIERGQFLHNAAREGGGLAHDLGDGFLVNSLFVENTAADLDGTAMLLASMGTVEVLHSTVIGLQATGGSGIEVEAGKVGITNTIVASHTTGISSTAGIAHQDFNLFFANGQDTQGGVTGGIHSFTANPLFVEQTKDDYHLRDGSPAVDTGVDAGILTDFDGDSRPQQARFDIGFDELIPPPGSPTPTPQPTSTPIPSPTPTQDPTTTPLTPPSGSSAYLPLVTK